MARPKKIKDLHELPPLTEGEPAAPTDLPGIEGKGVSAIKIASIEKAVTKYERKKEARCQISPDEIAAKNELRDELHKHRDELPVNSEGLHFYRCDGVDYILEESLRRRKVDTGEGGDD